MATDDAETWNRRQKSVLDSNKYMFDNKLACDVTFLVQGLGEARTTRIPAHKYVLYSRSPVFFAMFCGGLAENGNEVRVDDIPTEAFEELLRFLYYEEARLTESNVMYVLYGAKKYLVNPLITKCQDYVAQAINVKQVCGILQQSLAFSDDNLRDRCLAFISDNTEEVVNSGEFEKLSDEAVSLIVKRNELCLSEAKLFEACISWAKVKLLLSSDEFTGLRQTLENLLPYIRFPTMSLEEFSTSVVPTDVLTADEKCEIYQYLTCPVKPRTKFETSERISKQPSMLVLSTQYELVNFNGQGQQSCRGRISKTVRIHALHFIFRTQYQDRFSYSALLQYVKLDQSHGSKQFNFGPARGPPSQSVVYIKPNIMEEGQVQFEGKSYSLARIDFETEAVLVQAGDFVVTTCVNIQRQGSQGGMVFYPARQAPANRLTAPTLFVERLQNVCLEKNGVTFAINSCDPGPVYGLTFSRQML